MGSVHYRAIHTRSLWRKVNSHTSLALAIDGKDGATGLFARQARINYQTHGDPLYVIAWDDGTTSGWLVKSDPSNPSGIRKIPLSIDRILRWEQHGQASPSELEACFAAELQNSQGLDLTELYRPGGRRIP